MVKHGLDGRSRHSSRSSRGRSRLVIAGWVAGGLGCAWIGYSLLMSHTAEERYRAAVKEADRLDPSWREGTSPQASEVIADDENSALLVVASDERSRAAGSHSRASGRRYHATRAGHSLPSY